MIQKLKVFYLAILLLTGYIPESSAQIQSHGYPQSASVGDLSDTMLNTKAIRRAARIKKITAIKDPPTASKTTYIKIISVDSKGDIRSIISCLPKTPQVESDLCITSLFEYHPTGQVAKATYFDTKGNKYPEQKSVWKEDKLHSISMVDTANYILTTESFDAQGNMISHERVDQTGRVLENSHYYYHADGLLDSIVNDHHGSIRYIRKKHGNGTFITMKNANYEYYWLYNVAGQCTNYEFYYYKTTLSVPDSYIEEYYYNKDGTLSHIVNKSSEKESFVTRYTYEYY
ncbi:hypothetical protein L0U88_13525 [Flavihumibacter sp. RY-1]|uniref:YD repeat-containing protein n=1 Tax=Flavihumibacter fluminis TaxID=2909236 RepID=A0ABS9BJB4_9BACT|nr:hypothetical protein [Flavihumibacter fluminis]MCF1715652.1 hypothetical protein [Flavihumibacter fluminis]